jgi:beta-N-acetylhexosaminidase
MKPVIFGLSGLQLTRGERALFRACDPAGFILFVRNIADREQLRALTDQLRALVGRDDLAILIDQEGGRVMRMKPPIWPDFPAGARFEALYDVAPMTAIEAARSNAEALALILAEVGITVNCLPVLDLKHPETHAAIGDRSLGGEPMRVAALGRAILDGLAAGGVVGVIKHAPGQGRATLDTHHDLPRITADEATLADDIQPFQQLSDAMMAMTGHVIYEAWDSALPATLSARVIGNIIRERIGFDGLLMTDDIEMNALTGPVSDRADAALAGGCDVVLHCSGELAAMEALAETLPEITSTAKARLERAMSGARPGFNPDRLAATLAKRDQLMALAA